ncbi:MAG: hypothetical protein PHY23_05340 [Oscillospiraceae bacterium]|nr:hypothetical protein [Oscillospiraceae bacterium]
MNSKKDIYKFTIQFSPGDPHHRQVVGLLNEQGRRKAQFIVNTVLHYLNCKETPDISIPVPLDYATIEKVVMQILEQHKSVQQEKMMEPDISQDLPRKMRKSDSIRFNEVSDVLGEDGIDSIMNSLAAIQAHTKE